MKRPVLFQSYPAHVLRDEFGGADYKAAIGMVESIQGKQE